MSERCNSIQFVMFINNPKYIIVPWKKKLCKLTICSIGYAGKDVVGSIINTNPPIIPPVDKNTSPTLFKVPLQNELNIPAYNSKLQQYNGT